MVTDEINFIVLKINDVNVNNLSREEAVKMFLSSGDDKTIFIEVRQRCDIPTQKAHMRMCNVSDNIIDDINLLNITTVNCTNSVTQNKYNDIENSKLNQQKTSDFENDIILTFKPMSLNLDVKADTQVCVSKCTQTEGSGYISINEKNSTTIELTSKGQNLFEQCLHPEIEIEEITLKKSDNNERLGIAVCNSNNSVDNMHCGIFSSDETFSGIYISEIEADSVAGRDGRLRQGDLILQINGKDIKRKSETDTFIAENNNAVTLLVSRCSYSDDIEFNDQTIEAEGDDEDIYDLNNSGYENYFISNDYMNVVDGLNKVLLTQSKQQNVCYGPIKSNKLTIPLENNINELSEFRNNISELCLKDANVTNQLSKDICQTLSISHSPFSTSSIENCTKKNYKTEYETEHIYETIPEDSESEPFYCSPYESSSYVSTKNFCLSSAVKSAQLQQKQRVCQWLGIRPQQTFSTKLSKQSKCLNNYGHNLIPSDSTSIIDPNKFVSICSDMTTATNTSSSSGGCGTYLSSNNNGTILCIEDHDNSSSAYNTGGSNNSETMMDLILNQSQNIPSGGLTTSTENKHLDFRNINDERLQSPEDKSPKKIIFSNKVANLFTSNNTINGSDELNNIQPMDTKTKNINERNAHQSMRVQKDLLQMELSNPQQEQQIYYSQFTAPNLSQYHFVSTQEVSKAATMQTTIESSRIVVTPENQNDMVWKVKRRPDGTRYIVRRPARNHLFRDRTSRPHIKNVRNDITTEEYNISEVNTGRRYWFKEERKKHIERARDCRLQHQSSLGSSISRPLISAVRVNNKDTIKVHHSQHLNSSQHSKLLLEKSNKKLQHQNELQLNVCRSQCELNQNTLSTSTNSYDGKNVRKLFLPIKNITSNLHASKSTVSTATLNTTIAAENTSSRSSVAILLQAPPNAQSDSDSSSKINNLLSITPV